MNILGLNATEQRYWETFMVGDRADIVLEIDVLEVYASRIAGISEHALLLETPKVGYSVLEVKSRTPVSVHVYRDAGIFKFTSKIMSQDWEKGDILVAKPWHIEHVQRRQNFRLNVILPFEYGALATNETALAASVVLNASGVTKNISEGGAMAVIDRPVSVNSVFKMHINLNTHLVVKTIAKVLEQRRLEIENKFATRFQFIA